MAVDQEKTPEAIIAELQAEIAALRGQVATKPVVTESEMVEIHNQTTFPFTFMFEPVKNADGKWTTPEPIKIGPGPKKDKSLEGELDPSAIVPRSVLSRRDIRAIVAAGDLVVRPVVSA